MPLTTDISNPFAPQPDAFKEGATEGLSADSCFWEMGHLADIVAGQVFSWMRGMPALGPVHGFFVLCSQAH